MSGSPVPNETIECPLCMGVGNLKRTEVLDRLGVKDFARVAQLSAEEAFRLLSKKHTNDHQSAWAPKALFVVCEYLHSILCYAFFGLNLDRPPEMGKLFGKVIVQFVK